MGRTIKLLALAAVCVWIWSASACQAREGERRWHDYGQMGDGHRYSVPLDELIRMHGHEEWEIVAGFTHFDGKLGVYKPGDSIALSVSVGPIGGRTYARSKLFGRGSSPMPVIEVMEAGKLTGKVLEYIKFQAGAC